MNAANASAGNIIRDLAVALDDMHDAGSFANLIEWLLGLCGAIVFIAVARMVGVWISRRISNSSRIDATLAGFLGGLVRYAILALAILTILAQFGVQTASLLAVLGAAGLAIGLALQGTLSNVAAGTMLLILRPFRVGDTIQVNGLTGTVRTLGLFGTEISTPENIYIFVPNGRLWNNDIANLSRNPQRRQDILVTISYDDDIDKAFAVLNEVIAAEDRIIKNVPDRAPQVMTDRMADFSIEIIVRVWTRREDVGDVKWDMTKKIKEAFDHHNITIPFPTRRVEVVDNKEIAAAAG